VTVSTFYTKAAERSPACGGDNGTLDFPSLLPFV
jgi:hypothetical protein